MEMIWLTKANGQRVYINPRKIAAVHHKNGAYGESHSTIQFENGDRLEVDEGAEAVARQIEYCY